MTGSLLDKSKAFALENIKVCNYIKREKKETVLTNQRIRSGTNQCRCQHPRGILCPRKGRFYNEAANCSQRMFRKRILDELLIESEYYNDAAILEQCIEVKKLLIAFTNTAKNRANYLASIVL